MSKTYNILDLFYPTSKNRYGMSFYVDENGKIADTGTKVTIFTGQDFYTYVRARHGHRLFDAYTVTEGQSTEDALSSARGEFADIFDTWQALSLFDYARIFLAYREQYKPLENYDRYEETYTDTDHHHKGTMTAQASDITTTPTTKMRTTTKENAYDGGETESSTSDSEYISGNTHTTGNADANFVKTTDVSADVYDKDVHEAGMRHLHGNIGVTTSAEMLAGEYDIRTRAFVEGIMDRFVNSFTYYVGGVEECR